MALNRFEGLRGLIQALQCACSCDTTDSLIAQTVDATTTGWPPAQRRKLLQAMSRIMPSWWPQRLHVD